MSSAPKKIQSQRCKPNRRQVPRQRASKANLEAAAGRGMVFFKQETVFAVSFGCLARL